MPYFCIENTIIFCRDISFTKRFPNEFYEEMYRLKGWDYNGNARTPLVGKLTNYLVYDLMPEGVLEELL